MIKFCLLAALVSLLNFPNFTPQTCYLEKYIVSEEGNTDTTFYKYDGNTPLLVELSTPMSGDYIRETFSYHEGKITSIYEALQTNNYQYGYSHDCFYNEKGLLEQVIDYDDMRVSNFYQTFSYDNKNRLVQHTWHETPYMEDTIITSFIKYYYEADKMIRMEEFADYPEPGSLPKYIYAYEYADKKNPTYQQYSVYSPSLTEKYVITKLVCTDAEGAIVDEYSYIRECTFNEAGYPLNCTVKYLDGAEKYRETYTYNCGN